MAEATPRRLDRRSRLAVAYGKLAAADPVLESLIDRYGRPDPQHWGWAADRPDADAFRTLLLQIVSQRLPISRSFRVFADLEQAAGGIDPRRVLDLGLDGLSRVGVPAAKGAAAMRLAEAVLDDTVDLDHLPADDDQAMRQLTSLRGIGPWSAQMFLLGYSKRPDILPAADFGIRSQIRASWRLADVPTPAAAARRGRPWSPYRSYAAALLWTARLRRDGDSGDRPGDPHWPGKAAAAAPASASRCD